MRSHSALAGRKRGSIDGHRSWSSASTSYRAERGGDSQREGGKDSREGEEIGTLKMADVQDPHASTMRRVGQEAVGLPFGAAIVQAADLN